MSNVTSPITLTTRFAAPAGRPQPLAFHDGTLWVGCWDTSHVYAVDPVAGTVREEHAAPGKPFGLTSYRGALRAVVSDGGDADDRYFYTLVPGSGFDLASKTACPDFTGSHLAADGDTLYLGQMHEKRVLALDAAGTIIREIALPTPCGGIGIGAGTSYVISADSEFEDLTLATFPLADAHPKLTPVGALPPESRGLAFDGVAWWTSLREANEIATFTLR